MASVPPLYDQVRKGSARVRARERALGWLGRPSYGIAAAGGRPARRRLGDRRQSGAPAAKASCRDRAVARPDPVEALSRAALYAVLAICAAALLRFARWAYFGRASMRGQPNETLQLTSARSKEAIAVSAYRVAIAGKQVSRILGRSLATELWR
jgi:hypothetical protein